MRKNRLATNTIASVSNQIITIACGFVLPRYMLATYGSTVNGLVSSVTQFLSIIAFMQMGVGAVVQSALYKPLAEKDDNEVSKIFCSAQKFFRTIAIIFSVYVGVLIAVYPNFVGKAFNYWFSASLIVIIGVNSFAQYYFGITNQMLLWADQKAYVSLALDSITLIINTIISIIVMEAGGSVQLVKLIATSIYVVRPLGLTMYVTRHYSINKRIEYKGEPIKQKWNGLAQHLASAVMDNTDVIILTVFSTLQNVSIYTIYHLVVNGIRQLITSFTVGVQAYFGRIYVIWDLHDVKKRFHTAETFFHYIVTVLFTCTITLIIPFVKVYTKGVTDIDYVLPGFAYIIATAQAVYCYRLVYFMMIKAAGHYKETQKSALIEMSINLVTSILFVIKFGLIGVAIGTFAATLYRTVYFISYLSKDILKINVKDTLLIFIVDVIAFCSTFLLCKSIVLREISYPAWIQLAIVHFLICIGVSSLIYLTYMFFRDRASLISGLKLIKSKLKRYGIK